MYLNRKRKEKEFLECQQQFYPNFEECFGKIPLKLSLLEETPPLSVQLTDTSANSP